MSYFTEQIYGFCQEYGNMELPRRLEEIASDLFADSMGCMKAGLYESSARSITKYLSAKKGLDFEEQERLLEKLDAEEKALFYGFVSHNFDFDNSSNIIGHNSAVLFPALLALSGETAVSGRDFIRAYLLGTEVSFKVASFMIPGMNFRGFHITPVFGVIGAAAACAWLLKFGEAEFVNAVSIAVSQCSGLMAQFGSMMKFCHCGLAASGALRAVKMALAGVTGKPDVLEGKSGFFQAYYQPAQATDTGLGNPWSMLRESFLIKAYPCCSASHSAIYGMQSFLRETGTDPREIKSVKVLVPKYTTNNLIYSRPRNETEAKFSMNFAVANVMKNFDYDFGAFERENIESPELRDYMERVEMAVTDKYPDFVEAEPCVLEIETGRGTYEKEIPFGLGRTLDSPLSREQLLKKFTMCTRGRFASPEETFDKMHAAASASRIRFNIFKGDIQ